MDRRGDGTASIDRGSQSPGEPSDGDDLPSVALRSAGARAAEIPELSRRALTAEIDLLAYVDELEAEIRRLRRRLGIDAPRGTAEGTA